MEHRSRPTRRLAAFTLVLFELVACDGSGPSNASGSAAADGGPSRGSSGGSNSRGLIAGEQCVRSLCDVCVEIQPERDQQCRTCVQLCTAPFSSTPCTTCSKFCDATVCNDECRGTPGCLEYDVVFQPTGEADPAIESACHALLDSNDGCGQSIESADVGCEQLGTVYDSATAPAAFRCLEQLPCDATLAAAYACFPGPRHGLAEWYCRESVRNGAASCDVSVRDRVARFDGWVLASVAKELQKCGTFDAQGVSFAGCVESWLWSVDLFRFD